MFARVSDWRWVAGVWRLDIADGLWEYFISRSCTRAGEPPALQLRAPSYQTTNYDVFLFRTAAGLVPLLAAILRGGLASALSPAAAAPGLVCSPLCRKASMRLMI